MAFTHSPYSPISESYTSNTPSPASSRRSSASDEYFNDGSPKQYPPVVVAPPGPVPGINIDEPPHSRLFVRCSAGLTSDELQRLFASYGHIQLLQLVTDKQTACFKGTAFVKFFRASHAALAIEALNGQFVGSSMMYLQHAQPRTTQGDVVETVDEMDQPPNSRLFILCPKEMDEHLLHGEFNRFGDIQNVTVLRNSGDRSDSRGIAFVKFTRSEAASRAVQEIGWGGKNPNALQCKIANPRTNSKPEAGKRSRGSASDASGPAPVQLLQALTEVSNTFTHNPYSSPWPSPPAASGHSYPSSVATSDETCSWSSSAEDLKGSRSSSPDRCTGLPDGSRLFISVMRRVSDEALSYTFKQFGAVAHASLRPNKNFGYIQFYDTESAARALKGQASIKLGVPFRVQIAEARGSRNH